MTRGGRCHALTVLDDHSRYSIGLRACDNERTETVQRELIAMFRHSGLPRRMLMDNGPPWGDTAEQPWTRLTAWLLRLGISISHGRPYHPQTQGKDERFHRTLAAEVLRDRSFRDLIDTQQTFDPWRQVYNTQRPHEALSLEVPASRYRASERSFPETLPPIEYAPDVPVRRASLQGVIKFDSRSIRIGRAFCHEPIGVRATSTSGVYEAFYAHQSLGQFDLSQTPRGSREILNIHRVRREGPSSLTRRGLDRSRAACGGIRIALRSLQSLRSLRSLRAIRIPPHAVSPSTRPLQPVTYVPERLLPLSPV